MSSTAVSRGSYAAVVFAASRFSYGICVYAGLLLLIATIMIFSYYCAHRNSGLSGPLPHVTDLEVGLDEATLKSFPKVVYSEVKVGDNGSSTESCCSVCLADYKGMDVLRLLPDCGHLFHLKCVDQWLRMHPTCPVCRTSPLPTPISTPLAEAVEYPMFFRDYV